MSEEPQNAGTANKFCSVSNLRNESDVEQFFVAPLLGELGFTADYLQTKRTVIARQIGKGKRRRSYIPDYVGYLTSTQSRPVLVVDAKRPDRDADEGVDDAQLYASVIRRGIASPKPELSLAEDIGQLGLALPLRALDELVQLVLVEP